MNRWIAALALWTVATAAAADAGVTPYTATYEVDRGSMTVGTAQITLSRNADGSYTYQSTTRASGFASLFFKDVITEASHFELADGRPRSLLYRFSQSGGSHEKSESIQFEWGKNAAYTDEDGREHTNKLTAGVSDRFLTQLLLSLDLQSGKLQDSYKVLDHREVTTYSMEKLKDEPLRTPAGSFDTTVLERKEPGKDRVMDFWMSPKLHGLPVQMQQRETDKATVTLTLTSISFDTPAPAASTGQK